MMHEITGPERHAFEVINLALLRIKDAPDRAAEISAGDATPDVVARIRRLVELPDGGDDGAFECNINAVAINVTVRRKAGGYRFEGQWE